MNALEELELRSNMGIDPSKIKKSLNCKEYP
jgi:hypothetical protein